jgi:hypothetical protein
MSPENVDVSILLKSVDNLSKSLKDASESMEDAGNSIDDLFADLAKREENRFFLFKFIDRLFPSTLGYRTSYIIFRPFKVISEIGIRIKWANQRVFRGWDDRAIWSIDFHIANQMVQWLDVLLEEPYVGAPAMYMPEECFYDDDIGEYAFKYYAELYRWDLRQMRKGFESYSLMPYLEYSSPEYLQSKKDFERGMELFKKLYVTLWT